MSQENPLTEAAVLYASGLGEELGSEVPGVDAIVSAFEAGAAWQIRRASELMESLSGLVQELKSENKQLRRKISDMSWDINPDRMGL